MELISTFLQQTITFFAIMDPIGISAIALSLLSSNITKTQITNVAKKSTLTIIVAFFVVLIAGEAILKLFGIDENSLKVMGGIILILMAISMVSGSAGEKTGELDTRNVIPIRHTKAGIPTKVNNIFWRYRMARPFYC